MFEKLSNSWELVKSSAQVLKADKELLVFPLISGIAVIVLSVAYFFPASALVGGLGALEDGELPLSAYVAIFGYYVLTYTVIFYFNSALVGASLIRLEGGDPTVGDGLRIASSKLGKILGYAVIAATVGMVLRALSERAGWLGRIVIGLIGIAWNLATYLVVPVLVTRDVGPIDAVKESASILKRTWGEQIVGKTGIGFIFGALFVGLMLVGMPLVAVAGSTGSGLLLAIVWVALVVAGILLMLIQAALSGIYAAALYQHATGGSTGEYFGDRQLAAAFGPK